MNERKCTHKPDGHVDPASQGAMERVLLGWNGRVIELDGVDSGAEEARRSTSPYTTDARALGERRSVLGLRRSFAAAAERDLLVLLNCRLGGAGVNHGARKP